tara:strand:+ start:177 stop:380 length:204 start_codon:yes stop_codon:yes gene_type:complete
MTITVKRLVGHEIPEGLRHPLVAELWAVSINGEVYQYCSTEAEAFGLQAALEEAEEARRPKFSGPGM